MLSLLIEGGSGLNLGKPVLQRCFTLLFSLSFFSFSRPRVALFTLSPEDVDEDDFLPIRIAQRRFLPPLFVELALDESIIDVDDLSCILDVVVSKEDDAVLIVVTFACKLDTDCCCKLKSVGGAALLSLLIVIVVTLLLLLLEGRFSAAG